MNHRESILTGDRLVCRANISLGALSHNFKLLSHTFASDELICMIKANAYGHDAALVATHLESVGAKWLGVATVDEGMRLRKIGVTARVLVMSGSGFQFGLKELIENELTPLVSSLSEATALISALKSIHGRPPTSPFAVHLDCDTGMTRGGFLTLDNVDVFLSSQDWIEVEGLSTHFANAEEKECNYSTVQMDRFAGLVHKAYESGLSPRYLHLDKSAAILSQTSQVFRENLLSANPSLRFLARPGISLYGVDPTKEKHFLERLKPVLSWQAPIVLRKKVSKGASVGYDGTFVAERPTEVAIVRVGYADGLRRSLSNKGKMVVGGMFVPIIGRVSMDLTALDVTDLVAVAGEGACAEGLFAHIIGGDGENSQTVFNLAEDCDTIPYEILTSISARVQRFAT